MRERTFGLSQKELQYAPWNNSASHSSRLARPKLKAASNVSGACCKTAWSANSAWIRQQIWTRPTPFTSASSPITTAASPALRAKAPPPGAPHLRTWTASAASSTPAWSVTITSYSGRPSLSDPSPRPPLQSCWRKSQPLPYSRWRITKYYGNIKPQHTWLRLGDIFILPLGSQNHGATTRSRDCSSKKLGSRWESGESSCD